MAIASDEELMTETALEWRIFSLKEQGSIERAKILEEKLKAMKTVQK